MADLAEQYSFDELRVTHSQNIVLPHVKKADLYALWQKLDAAGLASFLGDQKANIAAEMPADFIQHMQGTSLMSSLSSQFPDLGQGIVGQAMDAAGDMVGGAADMAGNAVGAAGDAVGAAGDAVAGAAGAATNAAANAADAAGDAVSGAAGAARDTAQAASGGMGGILKFLIPLLILAGLAWYFLGGGKTPEVAMPDVSPEMISVGDVNLGEQFTGITEGLTSTLGGITDATSAEAALPQLEGLSEQVGSLEGLVGQLGDEGKGAFGGIVQTALGTLQPLIEKAIGAAGEGTPVAGILNTIVEKLLAMAG
jgi:hypothetical protein